MHAHVTGLCTLSFVSRSLVGHDIVLEHRPKRYKFGCLNYGEVVPEWINPADNDRYDVFAPGYDSPLPVQQPYRVTAILGVLRLANCNHKIAVLIDVPGYDDRRAREEIRQFCAQYTRRMRVRGSFTWFETASEDPPSSLEAASPCGGA